MKPGLFRQRLTGVTIEAVQVTAENAVEVAAWVPAGMVYSSDRGPVVTFTCAYHRSDAGVGEWVWKDPQTLYFYPISDRGFIELHDAAETQ